MQDLILFPFNGNAREAVSVVEAINRQVPTWNLLGFVDDNPDLAGKTFHGYPVLGKRDALKEYPQAKILACPGRPENFRMRDQIIDALDLPPARFATLIHPSADIGLGVQIGHNTLIMAGVVLTVDVHIGSHCVILPNTVIAHESILGDYTLVGSNVSVSGNVQIAPKCYIGTGAKLIQEIQIAEGTLIGLGSVVLRSTEPQSTVVGSPARALVKR